MKTPQNTTGRHLHVERRKQVLKRTGLSHSHFYKLMELGLWIRPFKLNARAVGWFVHETDALITARTGGATTAQIMAIIKRLQAERDKLFKQLLNDMGLQGDSEPKTNIMKL